MNLLIDIWATGDGKMKVDYMRQHEKHNKHHYSLCDITESWLSVVSRFRNFAKKDIERIETFFNKLQNINENNGY